MALRNLIVAFKRVMITIQIRGVGFDMTRLTYYSNQSNEDNLNRELGDRAYPIWLLINPKYPAVRQDIWRHVLDEIQDRIFREMQTRIDTSNLYIRSAVSDGGIVPNTLNWWGNEVAKEIKYFRGIVDEYKPKLLISFGAFPYEFARRVFEVKPEKGPKAWNSSILKDRFEQSMKTFDINRTNRIPLLRRVIATDKFNETQNFLSRTERETYFHNVGSKIADRIIENKDHLDIWIK